MATFPLRLVMLLYCLSGIPFGVVNETLPALLRFQGRSLNEIGLLGLMQLPWSLKFVYGPLVDRSGNVRRWLVGASLALACGYLALGSLPVQATSRIVFGLALFVASAASILDVTLDGLFVRLLARSQLAPARVHAVNGMRLAAYKGSLALGGGVTIYLGTQYGFGWAFLLLAVFTCLLGVGTPVKKFGDVRAPTKSFKVWRRELAPWFQKPGAKAAFGLIFSYKLSIASLLAIEKAYWIDRGLGGGTIGFASGGVGLVGTVLGALVGSRIASTRGERWALMAGLGVQLAPPLAYLGIEALALPSSWLLASALVSSLALGIATAILLGFITRICDVSHAATQFSALTATYALTRSLGSFLGGFCAERFGYVTFFVLCLVLLLPGAFCLAPGARRLPGSEEVPAA